MLTALLECFKIHKHALQYNIIFSITCTLLLVYNNNTIIGNNNVHYIKEMVVVIKVIL